MAKIVLEPEFHKNVLEGAKKLCAVAVPNFGPTGRITIAEQKYDLPLVANSGRKILKDFALKDEAENIGAVILRDAALKVSADCGDGSLATVVLTDALIREGGRAISAGANPIILRRGMEKAREAVTAELKKKAFRTDPSRLRQLAVGIAKFEDVGDTVFRAIDAVGADGIITVQDSQASTTVLNVWDGVKYDYGIASDIMFTDRTNKKAVLDDPFILLVNYRLKDVREIVRILEQCAQSGARLLIIAQEVSEEVLRQLNVNVVKGVLNLAVGTAPGHGDTRRANMLALSAKTGAYLFEEGTGVELKDHGLEYCGRAEKAVLTKESTLLQGFPLEDSASVELLRGHVKKQLAEAKEEYEIEKLEATLSILNGKIAEIISGGTQEYEMFERKYLAENTVAALKSALEEGVLPGGGAAYLQALPALEKVKGLDEDEEAGIGIVRRSLTAPMTVLCENVGYSGEVAVKESLDAGGTLCYDTVAGEMCDPVSRDILDPAASVLAALNTAVSTAGTLLTSTAAVIKSEK